MLKKIHLLILLTIAFLVAAAPAFADDDLYGEKVQDALELVRLAWEEQAAKYPEMMPAPYVDINNTRIVRLTDKPTDVLSGKSVEELEGIECIIEFMMLTNYFGDTYPCNAGVYDSVVVHSNGKMEIQQSNLLNLVRARYYLTDYSGVIEEIIDLDDAYNGQLFE